MGLFEGINHTNGMLVNLFDAWASRVIDKILDGDRISVIRAVREVFRIGLKDAKDIADKIMAEYLEVTSNPFNHKSGLLYQHRNVAKEILIKHLFYGILADYQHVLELKKKAEDLESQVQNLLLQLEDTRSALAKKNSIREDGKYHDYRWKNTWPKNDNDKG